MNAAAQRPSRADAEEPWALRNGRWIVAVGATLTLVVGLLAVFVLPNVDELVGDFSGSELQQARADIRSSGLAIATGVAATTAGLLAWGRLELSRRQHTLDRRRHALSEESQRNERFSRAIELLGHSDSSVRVGALYSLEGLARDGFDRQTIYDVVCAYARATSPAAQLKATVESFEPAVVDVGEFGDVIAEGVSENDVRTDDYETAITICLRAPVGWRISLDLQNTFLADRRLGGLVRANLAGSSIVDCRLDSSSIEECSFQRSSLTRCRFVRARLTDCLFQGSVLKGCVFTESVFVGVSLHETQLHECQFDGATMDGATSWPNDHGPPPEVTLMQSGSSAAAGAPR